MELCGPGVSEGGGSLCRAKQLPRHAASLRHLHMHDRAHLTPRPWVNHSAAAVAPTPAAGHRVHGAMSTKCCGPGCEAYKPGEEAAAAAAAWEASSGKALVTGGGGYFGFRLGRALAGRGMSVILLDMMEPPCDIPDGAVFYQADIRDYSSLYKLCEGVDCIFHTASYGMSGPDQLKKEQVESINVGGTNNVINVCKERSVQRLVYTSTINVVFAGEPIEDGDEDSVPCVAPEMHIDHYSRTKAIAEKMVLSANGCAVRGGGQLRTCVLRPCGIYGPEERRHLHRVMVNVERRLFSFRFGDPGARMNWVHVDNLVLAHNLAAEALTARRSCVASGQAYFINDGLSVNLFDWLTPLFQRLGYSRPSINLPVPLVYSAAILVEYLHVALRPVVHVPLLFTRSEVRNIAVSHTFKIDKARRELGYRPEAYSLADSVEQCLKSRQARSSWTSPSSTHLLLLLAFGAVLLMLCSALWQY